MPELPEVETVVRQLNTEIAGKKIIGVDVYFGKRNFPAKSTFIETLLGKTITTVNRRAKIIIIELSNNYTMLAHLKMSGKFYLHDDKTKPDKHTHVVFKLEDGSQLFWHDVRKFGYLKLMTNLEAQDWFLSKDFGPEPLLTTFTVDLFKERLMRRKNSKIKATLLDQTVIAGIGNIYDVESLWSSKIHPLRVISTLTDDEISLLHTNIVSILQTAVDAKGTSSDDFLDTAGNKGSNQDNLHVYGKENTPCSRCKTELEKIKVNGRGTVFCPTCQT